MGEPGVLIVEDEMLLAMMYEDVLSAEGWRIVGPVGRLDKAIALAGSATIDVALLDVNLHGEPSYPVARVLAERGIPFAFVTGYEGDIVAPAFQARPVLTKPCRAAEIVAVLRTLLAVGQNTAAGFAPA